MGGCFIFLIDCDEAPANINMYDSGVMSGVYYLAHHDIAMEPLRRCKIHRRRVSTEFLFQSSNLTGMAKNCRFLTRPHHAVNEYL